MTVQTTGRHCWYSPRWYFSLYGQSEHRTSDIVNNVDKNGALRSISNTLRIMYSGLLLRVEPYTDTKNGHLVNNCKQNAVTR